MTVKKLKDSEYKQPVITTVLYNPDILLAILLDSFYLPLEQLNIIWNKMMFDFIMKYFRESIQRIEKECRRKDVEFKLIVQSSDENNKFLKSMRYCDKRHLDNVTESLQISDDRLYLKPLFNKFNEEPTHVILSNLPHLVTQKQHLFDNLWQIARPLQP
jgi:hypothetical protein